MEQTGWTEQQQPKEGAQRNVQPTRLEQVHEEPCMQGKQRIITNDKKKKRKKAEYFKNKSDSMVNPYRSSRCRKDSSTRNIYCSSARRKRRRVILHRRATQNIPVKGVRKLKEGVIWSNKTEKDEDPQNKNIEKREDRQEEHSLLTRFHGGCLTCWGWRSESFTVEQQ